MYSYHIKDSYFNNAAIYLGTSNTNLMSNKENGGYRPHFCCFNDPSNPSILWAIPQSTKVQKYQNLLNSKIKRSGSCDTIVIGQFGGRDNAFLIQNMFPISQKYIDHTHTINGKPVKVHKALEQEIITKAQRTLHIYKTNKKILFCDVDKLYEMILNEIS